MSYVDIDLTPMSGETVRQIRTAYGLTTRDMAGLIGVPQSTWSKWEHNYAPGPWAFLLREFEDEAVEDIAPVDVDPSAVEELVEFHGGRRQMAEAIGVSISTPGKWCHNGCQGMNGWGRILVMLIEIYGLTSAEVAV